MERKTIQKAYIYILAFAFFIEFFGFNHRAMLSLFAREQTPEVTDAGNVLFLTDIEGDPGYIYLDTVAVPAEEIDGTSLPVTVSINAEDEGNSSEYELGSTTIYPLLEKSKYFRVHTYGEPSVIKLELSAPVEAEFNTKAVTVSASVPVFFSFFRFLGTFFILLLIYILRPASSVYSSALFEKRLPRRAVIAGAILLNICLLTVSVNLVPTFHNPGWLYHSQYQRLAESFIEGRLDIDMDREEALSEIGRLSNPYDSTLRMSTVKGADGLWDIAYYDGKLYCYFGVVPVLIFYLPYRVLTGADFPTWIGVLLSLAGTVCGIYFLLGQLKRRYFKDAPFMLYVLLSFIMSSSVNLFVAAIHPDFYYLPIIMALMFSLFGLGLMTSAVNDDSYVNLKTFFGALFLALTAGCRPQFLIASVLVLPLFWEKISKIKKKGITFLYLIIPYMIVAVLLMLYNYARFGSPFDFGASYNLTTNDMTNRGFYVDRIPEGIFAFLFQPANIVPYFPFALQVTDSTEYIGQVVRDWMFGGVFMTRPVLWLSGLIFAMRGRKDDRRKREAFIFSVLCLLLSIIVIIADTEMAGIVNRYITDFAWILFIPACFSAFYIAEQGRDRIIFKYLIWFILVFGLLSMLLEFHLGLTAGELSIYNVHRYLMMKGFWY